MLDIKAAITELGAKINAGFTAIQASAENFHLLEDAAAKAIAVRDEARVALLKSLDDIDAALHEMRAKLQHDIQPSPAEPGPANPS